MRVPLSAALIALLLLGACQSRLNPFNWFGRSTSAPADLAPARGYGAGVTDNRALVDQVTALSIEPTPGGAVIRAAGLTATQGWWDAELVAENEGVAVDGVLAYQFRVAAPRRPTRVSTERSREISAGVFLSDIALNGVRQITVRGARNERTSRR